MAVVSTSNAVSHTTNMGPELRGGNITLERIFHKSDVSSRQTKIICTMGPACWDVPTLEQLIDAGLSMARFNFSHGDHAAHAACLERVRTAATNKNKHVGTLLRLVNIFAGIVVVVAALLSLSFSHTHVLDPFF
jgi:hypothetical protein